MGDIKPLKMTESNPAYKVYSQPHKKLVGTCGRDESDKSSVWCKD